MRLFALFTCLLAACLWSRAGHADIYVWVDENDVKHFTNQNPPPEAEVLMRTKEIPYDEAADHARREAEKRQELLRARAQLRELEERIAQQQAEAQRQIAEARRRAEEALKQAEDLRASAEERYDSDHDYTDSYAYYPGYLIPGLYYRSSKYYDRAYDRIFHYKPHIFSQRHLRFKRHRFGTDRHFRKRFKAPKFRNDSFRKKFNGGKHHFRKRHFKGGGFSRFRPHTGGRARFKSDLRSGFRRC
jgi:TolA-binding protein